MNPEVKRVGKTSAGSIQYQFRHNSIFRREPNVFVVYLSDANVDRRYYDLLAKGHETESMPYYFNSLTSAVNFIANYCA